MLNILIVDDEYHTREGIKNNINWEDLKIDSVRTSKNGIEALEAFSATSAEIVLTDIKMPKMDGIELAAKIRKMSPETKILFLTAYSDKEYLLKSIELRVCNYIEKPIDLIKLTDTLKSVVKEICPDINDSRIDEINRYIRSHLDDVNLSLQSIADHVSLSKAYLCVLYKTSTGITVNEYIDKEKIALAKSLLKDYKIKLYEISRTIGILDPNYFSVYFKKHTGLTPSKYRGE